MPHQVDGAFVHAMSGTELSRVRTEFRLRLPEPINQSLLESRGPTLLCNQVSRKDLVSGTVKDPHYSLWAVAQLLAVLLGGPERMPQPRASSRSVKDELANLARMHLKRVIRSATGLS
jgi:hypothetical protein